MKRFATALLIALFLAPLGLQEALAQQQLTVKDINAIPDATVDALITAGAGVTTSLFDGDVLYPLADMAVQFTAVVLTDPRNSGNSTPDSDTGLPSRVHVWVRDTTAVSAGNDGMTIQMVDGAWQDNGTLQLAVGDVITVTGLVDPFFTTMQISPTNIDVLGSYQDFGMPDTILDPVTIDATSIVNAAVGSDQVLVNWANLSAYNGQYIRIEGAKIAGRDISADRPLYYVTTDDGVTVIPGYTTSLRFRNDRHNTYNPTEFNPLTDDFVPPAEGAVVNIQGFLTFGGGGPDFASRAALSGAILNISPWEDADFEVVEAAPEPPSVDDPSRPEALVAGDTDFAVTTEATVQEGQSLTDVSIVYFTDADATEQTVPASNTADDMYSATIPGQAEGTFVIFKASATNDLGITSESDWVEFRVLSAISKVEHITETSAFGEYGESPFEGMVVPMDVEVTVQTSPKDSGLITLQDDPDLNPWSGVAARAFGRDALVAALDLGTVITIIEAEVGVFRNAVQLDDVVFFEVSVGGDPIPDLLLPSTDILSDSEVAQAHEGMVLRFENVEVTAANADAPSGFGEFAVRTVGSSSDFSLRLDDSSSQVSYSGGDPSTVFSDGEVLSFVRGTLFDSFGNHKLLPESLDGDIGASTNTATEGSALPSGFELEQNYPNPFNPVTTLSFAVPTAGDVSLNVFDVTGRHIAALVDGERVAGEYTVVFDASALASGVYLYRFSAGPHTVTKRMTLIK